MWGYPALSGPLILRVERRTKSRFEGYVEHPSLPFENDSQEKEARRKSGSKGGWLLATSLKHLDVPMDMKRAPFRRNGG